jgi:signal transduction histidine kinase
VEDDSELQMLRARLVTAGLAERRRIERALHDGVQQDLIALSVELQVVRDLVATDPAAALAFLDRIQQDVRAALGRVQTLAGEIYPAILDARGLPDSLRQAARASGVRASVEVAELGRYPAEIETAVFFLWRAVLDASGPGAEVRIRVREEDEGLQVTIDAGGAVDLLSAEDVVAAAGGVLSVGLERAGCGIEARFELA